MYGGIVVNPNNRYDPLLYGVALMTTGAVLVWKGVENLTDSNEKNRTDAKSEISGGAACILVGGVMVCCTANIICAEYNAERNAPNNAANHAANNAHNNAANHAANNAALDETNYATGERQLSTSQLDNWTNNMAFSSQSNNVSGNGASLSQLTYSQDHLSGDIEMIQKTHAENLMNGRDKQLLDDNQI